MNNMMNMMNIMQMLSQVKSNPAAVLGRRFNLPQNLTNPNDILQYLMNTGQITQANYNAANMAAKQFFNK